MSLIIESMAEAFHDHGNKSYPWEAAESWEKDCARSYAIAMMEALVKQRETIPTLREILRIELEVSHKDYDEVIKKFACPPSRSA